MSPGKRHLFFGLMHIFRSEYIVLSLMMIIRAVAGFASPLGLMNLLRYDIFPLVSRSPLTRNPSYIETGGAKATIKPWFWVLWLFLGPTIRSIAHEWYIFIAVSH